jgi:hypothetical protein
MLLSSFLKNARTFLAIQIQSKRPVNPSWQDGMA